MSKSYEAIYEDGQVTWLSDPPSDVDILVDFDPAFKFGLITFGKIEDEISDVLKKKVDLVMKRALKPNIGKNILKEVIYLWSNETSETTYTPPCRMSRAHD
ncbi:putative nucleotidyltransferase [Leptolyngbya sp. PCC 7375]|nr:putative nucleotidyltransferase [Leptolyngbya sp. PCC 7375]